MNMRQAVRQALYFHKKFSYPLDECLQEAFLGLILGFEHFDINKSTKFGIHITWWIRQNLYRNILVGNYLIRVPSHLKSNMYKVIKMFNRKSESYKEKNKEILITKIMRKIPCSKENAINIYKGFQEVMNIDISNLKTDMLYSDYCEFEYVIMEKITNDLLSDYLFKVFALLQPRESEVLKMRYGIGISEPFTLEKLGDLFGLTRERIRQIENKAIKSLALL